MTEERIHHTLFRSKTSRDFSLPEFSSYQNLLDFLSQNEDLEHVSDVSYLKRYETRSDVLAAVEGRLAEELRVKGIDASECKLFKWSDFVES